ncbi:hypothetical protein AWB67_07004 [Caballeronia terrestris]|uniref:Uncharacterized protein n=1 Tax=Caballeronia terrestris TaxID=1226301 RepID=A0A158KX31_9BURK|nr:hypothetical protein AWB67_07004 [Caballeronia terrestris]
MTFHDARHGQRRIRESIERVQMTRLEVMIAGYRVKRQLQLACDAEDAPELLGRAVVGVVARQEREVDPVRQMLVHPSDHPLQVIQALIVVVG